ncbi:MAG: hypothetical protein IJK24_08645 [Oscillospiraceae bacterium]|nr:hypothetical protein [Oscillospiraceae bacterium]
MKVESEKLKVVEFFKLQFEKHIYFQLSTFNFQLHKGTGDADCRASASAFSARAPVEPCGQCRRAMLGGTSHAFGRLRTGSQ